MLTFIAEIAVLIPCYNEEATIASVVRDFKKALPESTVFVYDNASTDATSEVARRAGAVVRFEPIPGKGNVVRRMLADIEADVYILVDGDGTYDAARAPQLVQKLLTESLDMVNAGRVETNVLAYRRGHRFGNWLLTTLVSKLFGKRLDDMLSGYRLMSKRFVKSFPALSSGFEVETELTVHALLLRVPIAEVPTDYRERPTGSQSKLHTIRDGIRIMKTIGILVKEERPLEFFSVVSAVFIVSSCAFGAPIVLEFLHTGLVPRLPTAVLAVGLMILGFLSLMSGLILQTVTRGRIELKRMHYLGVPIRFTKRRSVE